MQVSLLTCSPHEEIYSLYGHTAVRVLDLHQVDDPRQRYDVVFNYGVFNFRAPYFVARFVFGKTDYELGKFPTQPFLAYYKRFGSRVSEQVLNLSRIEKARLIAALEENYQPENRIYRYNIFYDNCSTRPRDIIERSVEGMIQYQPVVQNDSWRSLVNDKTYRHPWATFGNNMLLGLRADTRPTQREREFLPEWLMEDFAQAQIVNLQGQTRPLVQTEQTLVPQGTQVVQEDFFITPRQVAWLLLVFTMVCCLWQLCLRRAPVAVRGFDALLLTVMGLMGVTLCVMLFSDHPFTSLNLLLITFNPLLFCAVPAAVRGCESRWWVVCAVLMVAGAPCQMFQDMPGLARVMALCLLLRAMCNLLCGARWRHAEMS